MECRALTAIHQQHHYYFEDRDTLDIDDVGALESFFKKNKIDVCVNTAAYTAVDLAETQQDDAYKINAEAVGPAGPCIPGAPSAPCAPCGPAGPVAPVGP
jgi:dTDP-4-dehydrorhamnose reductase